MSGGNVKRRIWQLPLVGLAPLLVFSLSPAGAHAASSPNQAPQVQTVQPPAVNPNMHYGPSSPVVTGPNGHTALNCGSAGALCTEVYDSEAVFGEDVYVGHDEPSMLFYSNTPGSGYQQSYNLTLPRDPGNPPDYSVANPLNSYNMQLHPAFWFGMAMCDTQSYPQQNLTSCTPDSDGNVTADTLAGLRTHAGTAFMEMQFYPPGDNHQPIAVNPCSQLGAGNPNNTQWCAALNIDSLSQDPIAGTQINSTCLGLIGSAEYVNFGIVTTDGTTPGPAGPISSTQATYDGSPSHPTFFMNSGDQLQVTFNDIPNSSPGPNGSGLQVTIHDVTTNTTGRMVTSTQNGFEMVQKAPTGTSCNPIPYNFHPMYNTSSKQGRVIWAAHTYNISFSDEIGHWDYCTGLTAANQQGTLFTCTGQEGLPPSDLEATDVEDTGCFPPSAQVLPTNRCIGTNGGFDGRPYLPNSWPVSETASSTVPTPITYSSPLTGGSTVAGDTVPYDTVALETDLPRIEAPDIPGTHNSCQRFAIDQNGAPYAGAGNGCLLLPLTDESNTIQLVQVGAYPWFNSLTTQAGCVWQLGQIPNSASTGSQTINDFGKNSQYGSLLPVTYIYGSPGTPNSGSVGTEVRLQDFQQVLPNGTCGTVLTTQPNIPESPAAWILVATAAPAAFAAFFSLRRRRRMRAA